jgi:hypothetical protein
MTPARFIANMNAKQAELARMDPVLLAGINELMASVERLEAEVKILLASNKRLASLIRKK